MAESTGGLVRLVLRNWRTIAQHWPQVVRAAVELKRFVDEHPALPAWSRQRLDEVLRRLATIPQRHGGAARVRAMLAVVRDEAPALDDHPGAWPTASLPWLRRADAIERGLRLAESQGRSEQGKALRRLALETDTLVAELIEELLRLQSAHGSSPARERQEP